jgi:hypothetical protein
VTRDFSFWVEEDELRVRFVSRAALGSLASGHVTGGDYAALTIRLRASEPVGSNRRTLLHELGHYLVDRDELNPRAFKRTLPNDVTEEDVCDLLTWLPVILHDPRNDALRDFLGILLKPC